MTAEAKSLEAGDLCFLIPESGLVVNELGGLMPAGLVIQSYLANRCFSPHHDYAAVVALDHRPGRMVLVLCNDMGDVKAVPSERLRLMAKGNIHDRLHVLRRTSTLPQERIAAAAKSDADAIQAELVDLERAKYASLEDCVLGGVGDG